jgi:hypothetical protein
VAPELVNMAPALVKAVHNERAKIQKSYYGTNLILSIWHQISLKHGDRSRQNLA